MRENEHIFREMPQVIIPENTSGRGGRFKHPRSVENPVHIKTIINDESVPWVKRTIAEGAKDPVITEIKCLRCVSCRKENRLYFDAPQFWAKCAYTTTIEKARSSIERREYWQTQDVSWLVQKKDWPGLKSIAMTKNTITQNDKTTIEVRYFISSLALDVRQIARAIRGHWMVESYHWHLEVTFREDANHTLDKYAAYNLNIVRKIAINVEKYLDKIMAL